MTALISNVFSYFNRITVRRGNAEEGRSWFHNGKGGDISAPDVCWHTVKSFDQVPRGPALSFLAVSFCLTLSSSCFPLMPPFLVLPSVFPVFIPSEKCPSFFPLRVPKRKMIQTMEMSTYQLLVAISSRLPQPQIGPQIKYKTEPHAYCIWMLIPFHEIGDRFWHGISGGPSFMYTLRFMKLQHMIKADF